MASKSKVKNRSKVTTPRSTSTPPKRCVWQYENNPANAFRAIIRKMNLSSASIEVNNDLKIKGKKLGQRSQPQKGTSTPPEGCVYAIWKQSSKHFLRYHPETELIIRHQLKSIMAWKSKVNNKVKGHNPQKAHLHPLRDVCVQYENSPANALWDIIRKLNLSSKIK